MIPIVSLIVAGFSLLFAEIFIPGLVAGIVGIICLAAAVAMTAVVYGAPPALALFGGICFVGFLGFLGWMRFFPSSPYGRRLALKEVSGQLTEPNPRERLLGLTGETVTPLRPCGTAFIDGKRHDVITEGSHIEALQQIKVVKVEGPRILVRKI